VSARDVDHAEQLFGRIRGVLERAEWGTKAERTNAAWAILDEILRTPAEPPRLALARALVPECAVVPREPDTAMLQDGYDARLAARHPGISGQTIDASVRATAYRELAIYRAMIAASEPQP
jgi:hypothetical protein